MKSQFVALAIVLAAMPALAWGQGSCGCTSRVSMGSRPASYGAWADYQPAGQGCGCGSSCAPACCDPCCRPLLCIIPNTVKKIGCVLDCIIPRGPICCNTGCGVSCSSGCPSCSSGVSDPFIDDHPMPPKPSIQETRRQPTIRAPREYAAAPSSSNKVASRPATKSVLTRNLQPAEQPVSRANHTDAPARKPASMVKRTSAAEPIGIESESQSARRQVASPHNPLR